MNLITAVYEIVPEGEAAVRATPRSAKLEPVNLERSGRQAFPLAEGTGRGVDWQSGKWAGGSGLPAYPTTRLTLSNSCRADPVRASLKSMPLDFARSATTKFVASMALPHRKTVFTEAQNPSSPFGLRTRRSPNIFAICGPWFGGTATTSATPGRFWSKGVRDGCALGVAGFHDWTIKGTHPCMTRLNLASTQYHAGTWTFPRLRMSRP